MRWLRTLVLQLGRAMRKSVFRISDKMRFKPACSATETSLKIEISLVVCLDMVLSNKQKTKVLIRLQGCAGWSAPFLFANAPRQVSPVKVQLNYLYIIRASSRQNGSVGVCEYQRCRPACAATQTDQLLCCSYIESILSKLDSNTILIF